MSEVSGWVRADPSAPKYLSSRIHPLPRPRSAPTAHSKMASPGDRTLRNSEKHVYSISLSQGSGPLSLDSAGFLWDEYGAGMYK